MLTMIIAIPNLTRLVYWKFTRRYLAKMALLQAAERYVASGLEKPLLAGYSNFTGRDFCLLFLFRL